MTLEFEVKGGEGVSHKITADRAGDNLTLTCDCPTAFQGNICAHRLILLAGDTSLLMSGNPGEVDELKSMIAGTDVDQCMREIADLDSKIRSLSTQLDDVKKKLAISLND